MHKEITEEFIAEAVVEIEESERESQFPQRFRKKLLELIRNKGVYIGGIVLVSASFVANVINFLFNAFLGRELRFEDFAQISLIGGLLSISSILFGAFSTTANYKSAFLIGKFGNNAGYSFWKFIRRRALYISVLIALIWIVLTPFLMKFFHAETPLLFILFGLALLVGLANAADRGFISANLNFGGLAIINFFDPIIKFIIAVILVFIGLKFWTFSAIPIAILCMFFIGWYIIVHNNKYKAINEHMNEIRVFPFKFFFASILTSFSSIVFSSSDVLFANHYLSSYEAGKYGLLSLVGKMVYFLGGLTTPFIIPLLSRIEGANKDSKKTMYIMLLCTGLLALVGFICFGVFGFFSIPILYGKKAESIVSNLVLFTFGMMCYTISKVLVNYYLVKKIYTFTIATSLLILLQIILLIFFHSNASTIGLVMTIIWSLHLVLTITFHFVSEKIKTIETKILLLFRS